MVGRKEYGLIGRKISHSFSADYFNRKFADENIDAHYGLFDLENISELPRVIANNPLLVGLNVTSPYKREVIPYLDEISEEAVEMNSVNVIEIRRDADGVSLVGHNSDAEGFRRTLAPLLGDMKGKKALVMGTGGASSAVRQALGKEGISYSLVSRTPSGDEIGYADTARLIPGYALVVNATPLGMEDLIDQAPPIDYSLLGPSHVCYDLIYNPSETLFLRRAREHGAIVKNGLDMLIGQAEIAWQIWNGKR